MAKIGRVQKDVVVPSRTQKLQIPASNVRVVKRTSGAKRSMGGKR